MPDTRPALKVRLHKKYFRNGVQMGLVPIPEEMYDRIGRVASHWGNFENHMDNTLAALVSASTADPIPTWRKMNFRKRRAMFCNLTNDVFGKGSAISNFFAGLAKEAAELHWQRNIVVHGSYAALFPASNLGLPDRFEVHGVLNKRYVSLDVSIDYLESLWHDIAYLAGRLNGSLERETQDHELPLPERLLLQDFWDRNRQSLPIPAKLKPPRRPSVA